MNGIKKGRKNAVDFHGVLLFFDESALFQFVQREGEGGKEMLEEVM